MEVMQFKLSPRELEIVKKIADGYRTDDIAEKLFISPFTVKAHRKNILRKMNERNCVGVISRCIREGWL